MKQTINIKLLLVAATILGFAATVRAEDPVPAAGSMGLLGQTYAGLTYSYVNLDDSPTNADNFAFEYNQSLNTGLDGVLTYDWTQTGVVAGTRVNGQTIGAALRAFSTSKTWGKPYVEAGVGYTRLKYAGLRESSVVWLVGVGAEIQVAAKTTVTPYVQYSDAPDLAGAGTWDFGVKANYWVNTQWAVTGGISMDDDQNSAFTIGTHFRF